MDGHWQRGEYTISTNKARLDIGVIHEFLNTSYWAAGRSVETIRRSIENSIPFVLEPHRGQGLSKWLMEVIISHPELQGFRRWVLATKDAHELYRKFGFNELKLPERWMERHDPNTQETPDYWRESAPASEQ